jgi:molybdopterin converting factor subunit 1
MTVSVLFFGMAHDLTGVTQQQVEIPEGGCLGDLWEKCVLSYPRLMEIAGSMVIAVNQEVFDSSHPLRDGDEVAFLPPVSGGAEDEFCRITRKPIPTNDLAQQLKAPRDGAVVVFEGIVRDNSRGKKTLYLEYEAYEPMALKKMEEIRHEVKRKFSIDRVGMIHRLGRLEIGETSVAILVTSAHRRAAFEACHYAIDRLKQVVPIWKKEYFEDGAVWADGEQYKAENRNQKSEDGGTPVGFLTRNKS